MVTTADYLFAVTVYVGFRSSCPDVVTVFHVLQNLVENNIDFTQLEMFSTNHCQ